MRLRTLAVSATALLCALVAQADETADITARLSGTTIVTGDLDASVRFYTHVLGFRETQIRQLDAPASRSVYGIDSDATVRYMPLLPAEWNQDNPYLSSLNLVEIADAEAALLDADAKRKPAVSEIVLAYRVTGLNDILQRAVAEDTPIVTPLAPSATGKSMTLTILDPNGVRVHMYEYTP